MRIWFNQWFSTAYHLIELMRAGSPGRFTFVGSSANPDALYRLVSDEWHTEPPIPVSEAYVEYCLEFCKAQKIDVFFPRRGLTLLSRYREEFLAAGTKLAVGKDFRIMRLLDDKAATYAFFEARDESLVPAHLIAGTYEEFLAAYETLRPHCARVCCKLTKDEGAETFRVIDDTLLAAGSVRRKPGMKLTWDMMRTIVRGYDFSVPFMVMPYLEGQEISVDCLATPQGSIIIPRFKTNHRCSEIRFDEEIVEKCRRMMEILQIEVPINIQFKGDGKKYCLLEINPRMSGGLQLSCLATGINVPDIALHQLIGEERPWQQPDRSKICRVANLETPKRLKG